MLSTIKELFIPHKDYAGRDIETVISRLAVRTGTETHEWSYIKEHSRYENTINGMKIYPHELSKYAA